MTTLLLFLLLTASALISAEEDTICCEDPQLGCFSNAPPYDHLPLPSCVVNPIYELFTRANRDDPIMVTRSSIPVEFDPDRRTVFIVHGYLDDQKNTWIKTMRRKFLDVEDSNIIVVGWGRGSDSWLWNYDKSVANTRVAAKETALIAEALINIGGAHSYKFWCVGHGLGAHTCGHVGMFTHMQRVTGLDPSGPEYEEFDIMAGINPTSAPFVDIIHTDGESLFYPHGQMRPLGHMDFYPNGGDTQPGCITFLAQGSDSLSVCSHVRSIHYFTESIGNNCFLSCRVCEDEFNIPKDCTECEGCAIMGWGAEGSGEDGLYYLHTSTGWFWSPYCEKC